jgi:hypothetical protein
LTTTLLDARKQGPQAWVKFGVLCRYPGEDDAQERTIAPLS